MNIDIERLCKLSMFELDENKKKELLKDMKEIVSYVEVLSELNLSNENLLKKENPTPFRKDITIRSDVMANLVSDFSHTKNNSFTVPVIIE